MSDGCKYRVWDNGDTTSCGMPVKRAGLCSEHLEARSNELRMRITAHRKRISVLLSELRGLLPRRKK